MVSGRRLSDNFATSLSMRRPHQTLNWSQPIHWKTLRPYTYQNTYKLMTGGGVWYAISRAGVNWKWTSIAVHHSARGSSCTQQRIRTALECSILGSTNAPKCIFFLSHCYYIATTFSLCCCCYTSYMLCSTKNITKNNPQKGNNLGPRNCFRQLMYYKFLTDILVEPAKEWQGVCGGPTFSFLQQFQITSYADVAH